MPIKSVSGKFKNNKGKVNINLSLLSFKEEDTQIVYSPALDLSGYGTNEEEACKSFTITLNEFLNYTVNKGTFLEELKRLGWKISGSKSKRTLKEPNLNELLRDNEPLQEIINEKDFRRFHERVSVPQLT